jgi:hypothetical protein
MRRLSFIVAIVILSLRLSAQTVNAIKDTSIYVGADELPQFPGGLKMFNKYINDNAVKVLRPNHTTGVVIAEILIERNGKLINPGIIEGLSVEVDAVAIDLLKKSPLWKPGLKNGVPVRTLMQIPVRFNDAKESPDVKSSNEIDDELTIVEPWGSSEEFKEDDPYRIFTSVDQAPEFPGGKAGLDRYIKNNKKSTGKVSDTVTISFVVEKDGSLSIFEVATGFSNACVNEALRLLKQSPKWHPGIKNGMPVRTAFSVTIYFKPNDKFKLNNY